MQGIARRVYTNRATRLDHDVRPRGQPDLELVVVLHTTAAVPPAFGLEILADLVAERNY